jgi:16S rRNA G966 N2-methylase RsmD
MYGKIVRNSSTEVTTLSVLTNSVQKFYLPAGCSFILDTFPSASESLARYTLDHGQFDLIVLDPPWHNKAVSRLKSKKPLSYNTMKDILVEIPPVGNWLASGGVVGIWCTNNLKMIDKVKNILFKRWGVTLVAEWVWLKVQTFSTELTRSL